MFWAAPVEGGGGPRCKKRFFRMGQPVGKTFNSHPPHLVLGLAADLPGVLGVPSGRDLYSQFMVESVENSFLRKMKRPWSRAEKLNVETKLWYLTSEHEEHDNDPSGVSFRITTDAPESRELEIRIYVHEFLHYWESAHSHSLKLAAQHMTSLSKIMAKRKAPGCVFLHGADLFGSDLSADVLRLARQAGLRDTDVHVTKLPRTIGPLYGGKDSLIPRITVEEFITQGTGIGLQKKLPGASGWEEEAPLLFYYVS